MAGIRNWPVPRCLRSHSSSKGGELLEISRKTAVGHCALEVHVEERDAQLLKAIIR